MNKFSRLIRYDLPMHFVLFFTNLLPDNVVFIRLRGRLASPFFKQCGKRLGIGRNVTFYNPSKISIGSDVYIAYGCWLSGSLKIENEVLFGPYCVVAPGNHTRKDGSFRFAENTNGAIRIEKGAWMGAHSLIVGNNSVLGKGSVLAANSTLVNISEKDSVYAGSPAKQIKKIN
jgi:acetyltransferase-like isoleucine patch superfamily enzyme